MNQTGLVVVAIAILHQGDRFLMQLRDDIPGILYPGHWGLFGGHLEPGETPEVALRRELVEEIGYCPPQLALFGQYADERVVRYVFQGALEVGLEALVLGEGWDFGLLTVEEIQKGDRFSPKAGVRPLGAPHQRILLDFVAQNRSELARGGGCGF
ncbi:MAG: NUDIX hydrolase [Desertifilum sp.]|nr:NUDIX hydrolase [Desertifilum sp.]